MSCGEVEVPPHLYPAGGSKEEVLCERSHGDRPQLLRKSIHVLLHPNDSAARKGFCHRGCRECDRAEREGTSFTLPMLCFPMFFSHACKDKKLKTIFTLIPNILSILGAEFSFQLPKGRGKRRGCTKTKQHRRCSPFFRAAHRQSNSHTL